MAESDTLTPAYSLWASPTGTTAEKLQKEIETQASEVGGPVWGPHVTVAPGIQEPEDEVIAKTKELAASLKPYYIRFLDVTCGAHYFQCVYLLCAKDPEVVGAAEAAKKAFSLDLPPYMPHLSLVYSDMDPANRQAAASKAVGRLYGEKATYDTLLTENGFWVRTLQLWYTPDDQSCTSWRLVAEFPLGEEQQ